MENTFYPYCHESSIPITLLMYSNSAFLKSYYGPCVIHELSVFNERRREEGGGGAVVMMTRNILTIKRS